MSRSLLLFICLALLSLYCVNATRVSVSVELDEDSSMSRDSSADAQVAEATEQVESEFDDATSTANSLTPEPAYPSGFAAVIEINNNYEQLKDPQGFSRWLNYLKSKKMKSSDKYLFHYYSNETTAMTFTYRRQPEKLTTVQIQDKKTKMTKVSNYQVDRRTCQNSEDQANYDLDLNAAPYFRKTCKLVAHNPNDNFESKSVKSWQYQCEDGEACQHGMKESCFVTLQTSYRSKTADVRPIAVVIKTIKSPSSTIQNTVVRKYLSFRPHADMKLFHVCKLSDDEEYLNSLEYLLHEKI